MASGARGVADAMSAGIMIAAPTNTEFAAHEPHVLPPADYYKSGLSPKFPWTWLLVSYRFRTCSSALPSTCRMC